MAGGDLDSEYPGPRFPLVLAIHIDPITDISPLSRGPFGGIGNRELVSFRVALFP